LALCSACSAAHLQERESQPAVTTFRSVHEQLSRHDLRDTRDDITQSTAPLVAQHLDSPQVDPLVDSISPTADRPCAVRPVTVTVVILASRGDRLAPLGPPLELYVSDVDTRIDDVDVHTLGVVRGGERGGGIVVSHQGGQGEMRSVRDSRETPGGGTLVRNVVPVRGDQGVLLRPSDLGEALQVVLDVTSRLRIERLGPEIEPDDLVVLDVLYLGARPDQVQGGLGELSGVSVEAVLGVSGGLEDLGDAIERGEELRESNKGECKGRVMSSRIESAE
jgi:hypothetical protein